MNQISKYTGQCSRVDVGPLPNLLTWTFEDGTQVQTTDLDMTELRDRHLIAGHAERLGLGRRAEIVRHLVGRYDEGKLLPLDGPRWGDDAGFSVD